MPRYKITIEYLGAAFSGWQKQPSATTVQEIIEKAIESFAQTKVEVFGSGRTDAGVHAFGQIAHFDLPIEYEAYKIISAINHFVRPHPIVIHSCEMVSDDFHARFSATSRSYVYKILNQSYPSVINDRLVWHIPQQLDVKAMNDAAQVLIGKHNFSSFRSAHCQSKNPVKTISKIEVRSIASMIEIYISAPSFMHNQVRIITGCLVKIGVGKADREWLKNVLEARDRTKASETAPPHGLYLMSIEI